MDLDLSMLLGRLGLQRHAGALKALGMVSLESVLLGEGGAKGVAGALGLQGEPLTGWLEAFGED